MDQKFIVVAVIMAVALVIAVSVTVYYVTRGEDTEPQKPPVIDAARQASCDPWPYDGEANVGAIVGGETVSNRSLYPWMVRLQLVQRAEKGRLVFQPLCGASIVDELHILTAARCLLGHVPVDNAGFNVGFGQISVTLGGVGDDPNVLRVPFKNFFVHKGFLEIKGMLKNNIALIRLSHSLKDLAGWNSWIRPICLPAEHMQAPGSCEVTGWGLTDPYNLTSHSLTLQKLAVRVFKHPQCQSFKVHDKNLGYRWVMNTADFCSSPGKPGGHSVCDFDWGGPLACKDKDGWKQYGIVSITPDPLRCGKVGYASFYTSVPFYRSWIEHVAKPALSSVSQTRAYLLCWRRKCMSQAGDRAWEREKDRFCAIFAAYVLCTEKEVAPQRCQRTIVPPGFPIRSDAQRNWTVVTCLNLLSRFTRVKLKTASTNPCRWSP